MKAATVLRALQRMAKFAKNTENGNKEAQVEQWTQWNSFIWIWSRIQLIEILYNEGDSGQLQQATGNTGQSGQDVIQMFKPNFPCDCACECNHSGLYSLREELFVFLDDIANSFSSSEKSWNCKGHWKDLLHQICFESFMAIKQPKILPINPPHSYQGKFSWFMIYVLCNHFLF